MFPIGDDNSDRTTTPYVNYLLIALNIIVFVFLQGMTGDNTFTYSYATVPAEILTGHDIVTNARVLTDPLTGEHLTIPGLGPTPVSVYFTLITSMFMHGGWAHIAGNMLYLWIFGDNIENAIGHRKYLFFYLLCGIIASLSHVLVTKLLGQDPLIPSLGASGAISGVLGAYILLFPKRRVTMFIFRFITHVSAIWAIGIWIVLQIVNGLGMLGGEASGVAYAAHIGGFIAGMLLISLFRPGRNQ
jgi:membrane associated rhomboid family serine protease